MEQRGDHEPGGMLLGEERAREQQRRQQRAETSRGSQNAGPNIRASSEATVAKPGM
jgi:hypothetical protein